VTLEVVVVAAIRIAGSLPVLRWPLLGGLLAVLVDLSDLLLFDVLDLGGVPDYQTTDKWLDQVYLAAFLVVALRWRGPARAIAVALYAYRLVGFLAFEVTGDRAILLAVPNVFEFWFLFVAAVGDATVARWSSARLALAVAVLAILKLAHEWALHGARLFDGIGALEALELLWRRLSGG
jgi:hypothetical protein